MITKVYVAHFEVDEPLDREACRDPVEDGLESFVAIYKRAREISPEGWTRFGIRHLGLRHRPFGLGRDGHPRLHGSSSPAPNRLYT